MHKEVHGKKEKKEIQTKKEGYQLFSKKKKAEKHNNLILKLEFLHQIGMAKQLV